MYKETTSIPANASGYDFFPLEAGAASSFTETFSGKKNSITIINSDVLKTIAEESFRRLSFYFTEEHLKNLINACLSPDASENDRFVCGCLLANASVAAKGKLPLCQDTGIANIFGWKDSNFITLAKNGEYGEYEALSEGAANVYKENALRFSTNSPTSFFEEKDPKNNMPAQITIFSEKCGCAPVPNFYSSTSTDFGTSRKEPCLKLLFCAKGGGSSNKTSFIQGTKALLNYKSFEKLLREQIAHIGTSACPPYTIAVIAGGLSPEQNMLTVKLATCGAYSGMTYEPNDAGFRDKEIEQLILKIARETGFGAQFGGTQFALDAIAIRLPRHGASCPISVGVSCSAHRNIKAFITARGFFIEKAVKEPETLPHFEEAVSFSKKQCNSSQLIKNIKTDDGIKNVLNQLHGSEPGTRITISGTILVARDKAHARWLSLIESGKNLPDYCTKYPICYAGPARTPEGFAIGSFGPTTAGRMDSYAESLMQRGAALVTIAKGNRSDAWINACRKYNAFYLGTPGGIAALIASEYIISQKIIDYEDLGMEAVRLVTVKDLPAFVITDDTGADFYDRLKQQ